MLGHLQTCPRMLHGCSRARRLGSPARELPEGVCTLQPLFGLAAIYEQGCGSRSFCFVAPTHCFSSTVAGLQMSRVLSCDAAPFTSFWSKNLFLSPGFHPGNRSTRGLKFPGSRGPGRDGRAESTLGVVLSLAAGSTPKTPSPAPLSD